MNDRKKRAMNYIDENASIFTGVSDRIWDSPELSLREHKAASLYCGLLEEHGFRVEKNLCSLPTAFSGSFGEGKPVIGILGEFDALDGLSQEAGALERRPAPYGNGPGHGCGHNLLGAGALAAAFAIKDYLQSSGVPGTVVFYGCPGEEGGSGKAFMARHGLWAKLDAALSWHPADVNEVRTGTNNTSVQVLYQFKGVASHAAANPEDGRSALDAVELMNVGAQFLREHIPSKCRVHYAITDAGGLSPNVVQPKASVLYMVRSSNVPNTLKLLERVDKIAEGAALMTGTETKRLFLDGTADLIPNFTLERVLYENFREVGVPELTEEERAFSASLRATYEISGVSGVGPSYDKKIEEDFLRKTDGLQKPICDFLLPQFSSEGFMPGSTDVGDVSWQTPTAQINAVTLPLGCPGHSWQAVSCGKSPIAQKGMLNAGKVLALAAIDLFEDSALLAEAKNEFEKRSALGYTCPIPENLTAEEFISGVCSPPSAL